MDNRRSSSWTATTTAAFLLCAAAIGCASAVLLERRRKRNDDDNMYSQKFILEWERKRQEERTGRIRAEQKLREALAKLKVITSNEMNDVKATMEDPYLLPLSTIGIVRSPYPKRMGTPRQGSLVPSSRGYIQFTSSIASESIDGIDEYSHLWIIFQFHENTNLTTTKKTKIRPPRGKGIKVGQLSTRSPHRPNPLGLSLVTIDRWDPSLRRLYIRALDLVNGTPVYDIKPYVHWDIPLEVSSRVDEATILSGLKLPSWVENNDDVLPDVIFESQADDSLQRMIENNTLSPQLYPCNDPRSFNAAKQTLIEILAQDPRSSHKGLTNNQRGSLSSTKENNNDNNNNNNNDNYRLLFGNSTVEFIVQEQGAIVKNILESSKNFQTSYCLNNGIEESDGPRLATTVYKMVMN